jgi:hypothetical protein
VVAMSKISRRERNTKSYGLAPAALYLALDIGLQFRPSQIPFRQLALFD